MNQESQILATIEEMTSSFNRGEIDRVMATYERGAVVMGEPNVAVSGDAALREMFAGFVAAQAQFSFGGHEVVQAGDLALHLTPWKMQGAGPDGSPMAASGLSVAVLRKQPDGRWLMVIDHPFGDAITQHAPA